MSVSTMTKFFRNASIRMLGEDRARWWVLCCFCGVSFVNAVVSLTYSSLPQESKEEYPALKESDLTLMLLWCAVLPVLVLPLAMWILTMPAGLRYCIQVGGFLTMAGACIRYIPCWFSAEMREEVPWLTLGLVHAGQILNALAFALFMASPSQLSATWFPAHQRTTATAVCAIFCEVGYAFAFFVPRISTSIQRVLLQELNLAAMCFVCTVSLSFLPDAPTKQQPSFSALISQSIRDDIGDSDSPSSALAQLRGGLSVALGNRSFVFLAAFVGVSSGVWTGWCPMLPAMLMPTFMEGQADEMSLVANIATIVGGLAIGPVADRYFEGNYRRLLVILTLLAIASFSWFTIALPTPIHSVNHAAMFHRVRHMSWTSLHIPVILTGLFQGAIVPLTYEAGAELCFPISEGTSGGIYQIFVNSGQMLFLFIPLIFSHAWFNLWCLVSLFVGLVGLAFVKIDYRRQSLRKQLALYDDGDDEELTEGGEEEGLTGEGKHTPTYGSVSTSTALGQDR